MRRLLGLVAVAVTLATPIRAEERVDVTATDGTQLIATLEGTSGPGVVMVHGEGEDRRRFAALAAELAARGYRTLRVDLRGSGDSQGAVDLRAADRDVEGAYRYVLGRKIRPVFLVGEGIGARAALVVAGRLPVAGVAVLAPPHDAAETVSALVVPVLALVRESDRDVTMPPPTRTVVVSDADIVASPRTVPALLEVLGAKR
jgi:pimeloyl-ACP methyl ester carboxylesterase